MYFDQAALVFFGLVDALSHLIHLVHIIIPGHFLASPALCTIEVSRLLGCVADFGGPKMLTQKRKKQKHVKRSQATLHLFGAYSTSPVSLGCFWAPTPESCPSTASGTGPGTGGTGGTGGAAVEC